MKNIYMFVLQYEGGDVNDAGISLIEAESEDEARLLIGSKYMDDDDAVALANDTLKVHVRPF